MHLDCIVISGSCGQIRWKHAHSFKALDNHDLEFEMYNERDFVSLYLILWSERNQFPMDYIYFARQTIAAHSVTYASIFTSIFHCSIPKLPLLIAISIFISNSCVYFLFYSFTFNGAFHLKQSRGGIRFWNTQSKV